MLLFEPKTEAVYNSVLVWLLFDEETVTGVTCVVFVQRVCVCVGSYCNVCLSPSKTTNASYITATETEEPDWMVEVLKEAYRRATILHSFAHICITLK